MSDSARDWFLKNLKTYCFSKVSLRGIPPKQYTLITHTMLIDNQLRANVFGRSLLVESFDNFVGYSFANCLTASRIKYPMHTKINATDYAYARNLDF
ncbi:hypothetical protein [Nostoc sp. CALU 546]|uniref:hypothetical protein n=1 Tax=Nostoc sp. CALU 546 TaxID=1867241 RepID=UPI003B67F3BE